MKGRHVARERAEAVPRVRLSPEAGAARSCAELAWYLDSVPTDEEAQSIGIHDAAEVVLCGDPECAGPSGSGRWVGYRERCPKCGGYAMTLVQVANHRERVLVEQRAEES